MFRHHPDGLIYVGEYVASLADFAVDVAVCGLPPYPGLPAGYRERRCATGKAGVLFSADSQAPDLWTGAQTYLAAEGALLAAQAARLAPVDPPEPTLEQRREAMVVTRTQGLLALLTVGVHESDIQAYIDAKTDPAEKEVASIYFRAATWKRTHPLMAEVATALNVTAEQMDGLFVLAATYE